MEYGEEIGEGASKRYIGTKMMQEQGTRRQAIREGRERRE